MSWDSEGEELDCSRHRRSRFKGRAVRDSESRGEAVWTYVHVCVRLCIVRVWARVWAQACAWDGIEGVCACQTAGGGSGAIRRHGRRAVDGQAAGGA